MNSAVLRFPSDPLAEGVVHLPGFKAECNALLAQLQELSNGRPKSVEHLRFHLAEFAEIWFKLGQSKSPARTESLRQDMAVPIDTPAVILAPRPRRGIAPKSRALDPAILAKMEFSAAAKAWLETGRARLKQRTVAGYVQYIKQLGVYFDGMTLDEIHIGHLLEYQVCRTENSGGEWYQPAPEKPTPWPKKSQSSNTNHEVNTLQQILRLAKLWAALDDVYEPLPSQGFKKPMVMTDAEKRRFYIVAASKPEFALALWVATVTNNTSASGCELRNLRLGDLSLDGDKPSFYIDSSTAKCRNRGRSLELNKDALDAMRKCRERAARFGSFRDEHYLFPFRIKTSSFDPNQPATAGWLRRPWNELREATGLPWLTPHCLRHQCLTELDEAGVPRETIRKIAGHLSPEMSDHYSHGRRDQQAEALNKLAPMAAVIRPKKEKRAAAPVTPMQRRIDVSRLIRGRRGVRKLVR